MVQTKGEETARNQYLVISNVLCGIGDLTITTLNCDVTIVDGRDAWKPGLCTVLRQS
jgi:hypothetical protein